MFAFMQLQKQLNRVVNNKEYAKYLLVVPPEAVQELNWKVGEELEHEVKEQTLVIRKAPQSEFKARPTSANAMRLMEKHRKLRSR